MMFPYPSAEGLHVGNMFAFTGSDTYGRFKRLQGHDVFQPIGFDAFGIHSENYAIKLGIHPAELIPRNIANFRRQLVRIGGMFDWRNELATTDPAYYKWTQWLFLQLFKAGKAYRKYGMVNWCPECKTVLANEQVINGFCERHPDTRVEQRALEQWYFRITEYADRLLANLDDRSRMDWSASTSTAQRNWLGRSEGAEIEFDVEGDCGAIRVFTTRPDTIFGATFMVLAGAPAGGAATTDAERPAVEAYRARSRRSTWSPARWATRTRRGLHRGVRGQSCHRQEDSASPLRMMDRIRWRCGARRADCLCAGSPARRRYWPAMGRTPTPR
jgi:leucyl-tRNA synthetase